MEMQETTTQFSQVLIAALEQKNLSIKDLSKLTDSTYEYMRRLVRGQALPSKYMLRAICEELNLNFEEIDKTVRTDQIKTKFGYTVPDQDDENLETLLNVWKTLSKPRQQWLVQQALAWHNAARPRS